jgi:hypothetical protein
MNGFGWETFFFIGVVILGVAIFVGMRRHQTRNRANDAVRDAATRELRENPERYEERTHAKLDERLRPER